MVNVMVAVRRMVYTRNTFAHSLVVNSVAIFCSEALVKAASLVEQPAVVHRIRLHLLDTSPVFRGGRAGRGVGDSRIPLARPSQGRFSR